MNVWPVMPPMDAWVGWGGVVALGLAALLAWVLGRRARTPRRSASTFFPSDLESLQDTAMKTMRLERRQTDGDPQSGPGTQWVDALSLRGSATPEQHAIVMATEQCLVDVQMTAVGLIPERVGSVHLLDALERLRARVQLPFDKLGIHLSWRIDRRDELEAVTGHVAWHALHIAQQSLANVVQHARASRVEVVCRYVPENDTLVMEVRDNGRGMARSHGSGAGLKSMRLCAQRLGGELSLASKQGSGTRVRLTLALGPAVKRSFDTTRPLRDDDLRRAVPAWSTLAARRVDTVGRV